MNRWPLLAAGCMALAPVPALASSASLFQVAQPIFTDAGVTIVQVPFLTHRLHGRDPAAGLLLTLAPNSITDDNGPEQRNVAAGAGIRFVNSRPGTVYEGREWPRLRGDTLEVRVDLAGLVPLPGDARIRDGQHRLEQDILGATLWCGLVNARAAWPRVRFVRYELSGGAGNARFGGLYALEPLEPPFQPIEPWAGSRLEALRR